MAHDKLAFQGWISGSGLTRTDHDQRDARQSSQAATRQEYDAQQRRLRRKKQPQAERQQAAVNQYPDGRSPALALARSIGIGIGFRSRHRAGPCTGVLGCARLRARPPLWAIRS